MANWFSIIPIGIALLIDAYVLLSVLILPGSLNAFIVGIVLTGAGSQGNNLYGGSTIYYNGTLNSRNVTNLTSINVSNFFYLAAIIIVMTNFELIFLLSTSWVSGKDHHLGNPGLPCNIGKKSYLSDKTHREVCFVQAINATTQSPDNITCFPPCTYLKKQLSLSKTFFFVQNNF